MSTPRIGPSGTPIAPGEARETSGDVASKTASTTAAAADHVTQQETPKAREAKTALPTTAALSQPAIERRARFGGDRGAWTARVRAGILFASENADVGQELLNAFKRGVA